MFREDLSKEEQVVLEQLLKEKYIEIENSMYIEGDYSSVLKNKLKTIKNIIEKI